MTWKQHKHWIREAVRTGQPFTVVARSYGTHPDTTTDILRSPRVQRYIASLTRWYADKALRQAVDTELSTLERGVE